MEPLLFLTHRIPYPPNKGDKITNFEMLKYFSKRYEVHLGTFVDDRRDRRHRAELLKYCRSAHFQNLDPSVRRFASAAALLGRRPLTLAYYPRRRLARWCDRVVREHGIRRIFVSSTPMYQFVPPSATDAARVIHYHDLDSDKWRQYAETTAWPMSAIYLRESVTLLEYERAIARDADAGFFVTPSEAELFRRLAPDSARKIIWPGHGLDHEYYRPSERFANPYPQGAKTVLFVGVLDYWPNEDAAIWYATAIHAKVRESCPDARFYVVGMNPTRRVRELEALPGVTVTGEVDDVRPWFQHASVVVAPLRIARGIQNKVLQAMAMERPVVMSRMLADSLSARAGDEVMLAERSTEFAAGVASLLRAPETAAAMGRRARQRILSDYSWQTTMERMDAFLAGRAGLRFEGDTSEADDNAHMFA
jgi:sugar transferase (PEP-CTERM/EpsH1 system associated)